MTTVVNMQYTHGSDSYSGSVTCSDEAIKLVRAKFNPSGRESVNRLKMLAAAFVTECKQQASSGKADPREMAVACTLMQQAVMMSVAAATADL